MFTRNRCRIFPGIREGLLCGKGVEPPRGRGRLSGARESQLFFGVYYIKNVFKYIGYGYFVYLSCVYIYYIFGWLCRGTCCSVVSTSNQCLVYHMLSKTRRISGSLHRVIGEVLVLVLLVVWKIPYSSCIRDRQDVICVCSSYYCLSGTTCVPVIVQYITTSLLLLST